MRNISLNICAIIFIALLLSSISWAQLESFGLEDKKVISLSLSPRNYYVRDYFLCAGTDSGGVHVRELDDSDSQWVDMGLGDKWISSVHIHHWGVGPGDWATIFVGIHPESEDSISLYRLTYDWDSTWIPIDLRDQVERPGISSIESFHYSGHEPPTPIFISIGDWVYRSSDWENWEFVHYGGGWVMETFQTGYSSLAPWAVWIGGRTVYDTPDVIKSLDMGETWEHCILGHLDLLGECVALAINPHDPDIVYIGTSCSQVVKTTDGGQNGFFLPLDIIAYGLAVDPGNSEHLVAAGSPPHYFCIYESYDAGESWTPIVIDSSLSPVTSCVADTLEGEFVVYLGTDGDGVYRYRSSSTQVNLLAEII